jgi:hypothetical protein
MILRQTFTQPINGYWDGGEKRVFDWSIDTLPTTLGYLNKEYSRIGSWEANHFFTIKTGKSELQTLANAKRHLRKTTKVESTFEYVA